jgi:tRNA pseudouridine38-40 synthase
VRTLRRFDVERDEDGIIVARVSADAFCHSMVRALVGALLAVGDGRKQSSWPAEVLGRGVRDGAVTVAKAKGLTLVRVDYPPDAVGMAARQRESRQFRG